MAEYPEDFKEAVADLIDNWEGGYENDPEDPGGETKFGISKRSYPSLDIAGLTRDHAIAIYYRDWWQKYKLDTDVPAAIRAKVFNMMVLMGPMPALTLAKRCRSLQEYKDKCAHHFQAVVVMRPVCAKYLKGWERRAMA
jgi:lysozyme family protein